MYLCFSCLLIIIPVPLLYLSIYIFIAPQKPLNVTGVATSDPDTLQVTWQQPLPRPGNTTYTVKVYEENDQKITFVYKEGFKKEISGIII
jgi:hypothetical protein